MFSRYARERGFKRPINQNLSQTMASSRVEFWVLKKSIEQFIRDLQRFEKALETKEFSEEEALEIMGYFVAVKENIEGLEMRYSRL